MKSKFIISAIGLSTLFLVGCATQQLDINKMRSLVAQAEAGSDGDCLIALHQAAVSLSQAKAMLVIAEKEGLDAGEYNKGMTAAENAVKARQVLAKACTQRYAALKQESAIMQGQLVETQEAVSETQVAISEVYAKTERLPGVTFARNSAQLNAEAKPILDAVAGRLVKENRKVEIAGHTSSTGNAEHNLELSQKRAESVSKYLVSKGVKPLNIAPHGYGKTQPVASNNTQEGRNANKRVEIRYLR